MKYDEKTFYKNTLISLLNSYIEIAKLKRFLATELKDKEICDRVIRKTKKSIHIIKDVNHVEILRSVYNTFIGGKETLFAVMVGSINHKDTISTWDKTEKGFQEFLQREEDAKKVYKEEMEKKKAQEDAIKKAKEEGKKVEFVMKDGKLEPVFTEEKAK